MINHETVKKFRFEAVEFTNSIKPAPLGITKWNEIRDARFAELVVRECMEQVWYTREDGINGNISEVIKERMTQHFGVKDDESKIT